MTNSDYWHHPYHATWRKYKSGPLRVVTHTKLLIGCTLR